jgi:hypothetical protein
MSTILSTESEVWEMKFRTTRRRITSQPTSKEEYTKTINRSKETSIPRTSSPKKKIPNDKIENYFEKYDGHKDTHSKRRYKHTHCDRIGGVAGQ